MHVSTELCCIMLMLVKNAIGNFLYTEFAAACWLQPMPLMCQLHILCHPPGAGSSLI